MSTNRICPKCKTQMIDKVIDNQDNPHLPAYTYKEICPVCNSKELGYEVKN